MPEENNDNVEALMNRLRLVKEEVAQIKKRLSVIGKEKEKLYGQKRAISDRIREKISSVKGSKGERNTFTQEARKAKQERDRLNKLISERIAEIKQMKSAYKDIAGKHGIKGNPSDLKGQIEKLEFRIQTEPMNFDKEQKVMKQIKDLKKQYAQFKAVAGDWEAVAAKSKEIDELKKQANEFHRVVQEAARSSQTKHESVIEHSKEIDDMKKEEEEVYQKFFAEKTRFKEVSTELKEKLSEVQGIKKELEAHDVAVAEEEKVKETKTLKERTAEVEEKISKKKKLTTEDLLIMQRSGK